MNNRINLFIQTFEGLIFQLLHTNVVIGGTNALLQHGLKISRTPSDLDLIIYQPTEEQLQILKTIAVFDLIKDRPELQYGNLQKAIKIEKDGLFLDIITETEPTPQNLLYYRYGHSDKLLQIQSIENVIKAKLSYKFERQSDSRDRSLTKYMRSKDLEDLLDLKNSNFNV